VRKRAIGNAGRFIASMLCLALCPLLTAQQVTPSVAAAPDASKPIALAKGKEVRLVLLEPVSSATATKGQLVRMAVKEDVTDENGVVVIPKGTPAKDMVDGVTKAVPGKKDGCISLRPVSVNPPNSEPIALKDFDYEDGDALGSAMIPLLPFFLIVDIITLPFRRNHVAGTDVNLQACDWQQSQISKTIRLQPSAIVKAQATSSGDDLGSVCPNGATFNFL
jgi:hypothetical protein